MPRRGRNVSIVILPNSGSWSIDRRVSYPTLVLLGILMIALVGIWLWSILDYGRMAVYAARFKAMQGRIEMVEEEHHRLLQLERRVAMLDEMGKQVVEMLGADAKLHLINAGAWSESGTDGMDESGIGLGSGPEGMGSGAPEMWPVQGWVTARFSGEHPAIDIAAPRGTPVICTIDGMVTIAGSDSMLGNVVRVENSEGYATVYGHNARQLVQQGDWVRRGDVIAFLGSTGKSSAPHLHYEIWYRGERVDPQDYLPER
jgi:murein DD-endopeptidase MepM/ murein hydrolase activator NlpD